MGSFTVTEPHPTVAQGSYYHCGRGGSGNYHRAPETTPAAGVPMHVTTSNQTASTGSTGSTMRRFHSGRGGAGNAHVSADTPPLMSFDEEVARAQHRETTATVGHVGRGGAGNCYRKDGADGEKVERTTSSRRSSAESTDSHRSSGFWRRLSSSH